MNDEVRDIVVKISKDDADSEPTLATVCFCKTSASLQVGELTVHLPWSELAIWQAWAAQELENSEHE